MANVRKRSKPQEQQRLEELWRREVRWDRWGPYLSERQWGTVREDYSAHGQAWEHFSHEQARARAYRWGEDGIGGICDRRQRICFALALWNGRDAILKERLFGLTGNEGNHGEDVKEYYYYLDSTPTHSYMKFLYKYPQAEFPYAQLLEENRRRGKADPEFELFDTGAFAGDRYFDVTVEYAKAAADDVLIRITAHNRGDRSAELHLLPTIWFRNTWAWNGEGVDKPRLLDVARTRPAGAMPRDREVIELHDPYYGKRWLACEDALELLFTDNESNAQRLWGAPNRTPYVKDGINDYVVHGETTAVNPEHEGTKAAAHYSWRLEAGESSSLRLRLADRRPGKAAFGRSFDRVFDQRIAEADEFYGRWYTNGMPEDARLVQRQAFAGLLWSKQFYHYDVAGWLRGDAAGPQPPSSRLTGRNSSWTHLHNADVISMPDKWEYPWYAAWDLAFHCIPLAMVDPEFAKQQLLLMLREWYMHPNGQIPAYEWALADVNPPVHAWSAWRVYKIARRVQGKADLAFLERVFQKLLLNFTWWVNRKDAEGNNVFQGGFLGLDNIGVFDRSAPLPTGGHLEQSDGTSWMGMYCLNMLAIALELARENRAYSDIASKFFEHFVYIAHAMNDIGGEGIELWDEEDGFYYDVLHLPDGEHKKLKVRSMVGLIPLFAIETLEPDVVDALPDFKNRMQWFIDNRPHLREHSCTTTLPDGRVRRRLSIVGPGRLERVLRVMLDETEFLSQYGVRALSRYHRDHPYMLHVNGHTHRVDYDPAESTSGLFGGNSNWRGPIWFPVNYLIVESLQKFHHYFGDRLKVECPTGSATKLDLWDVAHELSRRLVRIFLTGPDGIRPVHARDNELGTDPHFRDLIPFHEYFHGDSGAGVGASHQTGWTGLVAKLIEQSHG